MSQLDLFYLDTTGEFFEMIEGNLVLLPADTIILRTAYLSELQAADSSLQSARQQLQTAPPQLLLRLVRSSDGPPFRTAIIYVQNGADTYSRPADFRISAVRTGGNRIRAIRYTAPGFDETYTWKRDIENGSPGFFMTGAGGPTTLWRTSRLEVDALGRFVVTLNPARLAHGIATPNFNMVPTPLQNFLTSNFEQFTQAVARNAHLDVIDRANSLAEGILDYCLSCVLDTPAPRTLRDKLEKAKEFLFPHGDPRFPMDSYGYHLAHKIRLLHSRSHANRAVGEGKTVRPEVGMGAAIDISELLVTVGLGQY